MHQALFPYQTSPWDCHSCPKVSIRHGVQGCRRQTSRRCCKPPAHTASQRKLRRITQRFDGILRRSVVHWRLIAFCISSLSNAFFSSSSQSTDTETCRFRDALEDHFSLHHTKNFGSFQNVCMASIYVMSTVDVPMGWLPDSTYARII